MFVLKHFVEECVGSIRLEGGGGERVTGHFELLEHSC